MFLAAFPLYLILFLQCFTHILAIDLERFRHSLGIGRNQLTEKNPLVHSGGRVSRNWRYLIYSGYAKFNTDTNDLFDNEQLAGLGQYQTQISTAASLTYPPAWQAYEEMHYDYDKLRTSCDAAAFGLAKRMPTLIAVLAVGDEIFFSSQLKGTNGHDFVYESVPEVDIKNQLNLWYLLLNLKVNSRTEHSISQAYLISEADVKIPDAEKTKNPGLC